MKQQTCNSVQPTGGLFAKEKHFNWQREKADIIFLQRSADCNEEVSQTEEISNDITNTGTSRGL
jgi:hypothetical protein